MLDSNGGIKVPLFILQIRQIPSSRPPFEGRPDILPSFYLHFRLAELDLPEVRSRINAQGGEQF